MYSSHILGCTRKYGKDPPMKVNGTPSISKLLPTIVKVLADRAEAKRRGSKTIRNLVSKM
jgi:hypothetical protein